MTSEPDPYYAPTTTTYRARDLAMSSGFRSGLPSDSAKKNIADILDEKIYHYPWLHNVHLPVLRHLLILRIPHRLTLGTDTTGRAPLHATHVNDLPLRRDDTITGHITHLFGHHVTLSHQACAALYQHFNRDSLNRIPHTVRVLALAAGLKPDEIVEAHADGVLTVEHAQFMFALTEPAPGT